ncbi:hypothetical protein EJ08DRAFT_698806 [Tothia fuscella]|uniref:Uncharacterized protein n=1 Tax=Tothia fuscella TaxID=1048955 RepID=A0A9P4NNZ9_9PEZI|nr:hypothetical protein EJ08DRAFT_698806 [Tothia fuscella]
MSHLPPPPPNAAPYAPHAPPPLHSAPQYAPAYPPYQGHGQYQQPHPPTGGGIGALPSYGQHHSSPPRAAPIGAPKSRMQVTRYPPPPGRPQHQAPQQYPGAYQQPPPVYPPPNGWGQQQPYVPPPTSYPPPPHAQYSNAAPPPQYPPPPQQPPFGGHPQQPPPHVAPAPPPHAAYQQAYPPPPVPTNPPPWGAPQHPVPPPQQAWGASPPPVPHPMHVAPPTPAPTAASAVAPYQPPIYEPPPSPQPKDMKDPTFYDGWDNDDYEWGGALWPKASEVIDERFSLGQYIWHPPEAVSTAISLEQDEPLAIIPRPKIGEPPAKREFSVSKYFKEVIGSEGDEFVFNFQRIRYMGEWEDSKNDPIFIFYPENTPVEPISLQTLLPHVLEQDRAGKKATPEEDVMGSLEKALASYIPNPDTTAGAQADGPSKQEALLASLGVSGVPKPVYSTPFPAYAPVTEDPLFHRDHPAPHRTMSASSMSTYRPPPPPAPGPPPAPSPYHHSPSTHRPPPPRQEWNDPWKAMEELTSTHAPGSARRAATPAGSDFGDATMNDSRRSSSEKTMKDENGDATDTKKRKADEPDMLHRKRSKARIASLALISPFVPYVPRVGNFYARASTFQHVYPKTSSHVTATVAVLSSV